jgi:hypothetical protein
MSEATLEAFRHIAEMSAGEFARDGTLEHAILRLTLLRGHSTRAELEAAIALLQSDLDIAVYYGFADATPDERFQALLRLEGDYTGGHWDSERSYQDFLATPYWKTIAAYVKWLRGGVCHLCGTDKGLQAHHRTYEHKGMEHLHLDDLVVLCGGCHGRHHGKRPVGG